MRVYSDIYNSDAMLEEDAKLQAHLRESGDNCDAEVTILAILLWLDCHGLAAATGYSDLHFPCPTAGSSFSIDDLISSPLPTVVARYFPTLPVPSLSFLPLPSPSGTFCSRFLYVLLPSGSFCTLPPCSG
jgi:hypothetical protein